MQTPSRSRSTHYERLNNTANDNQDIPVVSPHPHAEKTDYERLNNTANDNQDIPVVSPHPHAERSDRDEELGSGSYAYATLDNIPPTPAGLFPLQQDQSSGAGREEGSYWRPSDQEEDLLKQLRKLKLRIFEERELE